MYRNKEAGRLPKVSGGFLFLMDKNAGIVYLHIHKYVAVETARLRTSPTCLQEGIA